MRNEINENKALSQNECYRQFFLGDIQIYNGNYNILLCDGAFKY